MNHSETLAADQQMWDLYTLRHEYTPPREDVCRSIYVPKHGEQVLPPVLSKYLAGRGLRPEYPDGKQFAVVLSHDIDHVYPPFSHTLLSSAHHARHLRPGGLWRDLSWKLKGKRASPYRNFREIMALEREHGAKSSFYFMTADRDVQRVRYDIAELESDLGEIADCGWEVGLHGGFYSCMDLAEIKAEKARLERVLGKPVVGYRNHYLRFRVPDTWEVLEQAGFKYDTTLGYNDVLGCRNGMCHPFRPYSLSAGRELDLVEIPLLIMDGTLFDRTASFPEAWEIARRIVDEVAQYSGVVTLLWHNHVFNSAHTEAWKKLYIKLLIYCCEKNAWITSGEEILNWSCRNDCRTDGR